METTAKIRIVSEADTRGLEAGTKAQQAHEQQSKLTTAALQQESKAEQELAKMFDDGRERMEKNLAAMRERHAQMDADVARTQQLIQQEITLQNAEKEMVDDFLGDGGKNAKMPEDNGGHMRGGNLVGKGSASNADTAGIGAKLKAAEAADAAKGLKEAEQAAKGTEEATGNAAASVAGLGAQLKLLGGVAGMVGGVIYKLVNDNKEVKESFDRMKDAAAKAASEGLETLLGKGEPLKEMFDAVTLLLGGNTEAWGKAAQAMKDYDSYATKLQTPLESLAEKLKALARAQQEVKASQAVTDTASKLELGNAQDEAQRNYETERKRLQDDASLSPDQRQNALNELDVRRAEEKKGFGDSARNLSLNDAEDKVTRLDETRSVLEAALAKFQQRQKDAMGAKERETVDAQIADYEQKLGGNGATGYESDGKILGVQTFATDNQKAFWSRRLRELKGQREKLADFGMPEGYNAEAENAAMARLKEQLGDNQSELNAADDERKAAQMRADNEAEQQQREVDAAEEKRQADADAQAKTDKQKRAALWQQTVEEQAKAEAEASKTPDDKPETVAKVKSTKDSPGKGDAGGVQEGGKAAAGSEKGERVLEDILAALNGLRGDVQGLNLRGAGDDVGAARAAGGAMANAAATMQQQGRMVAALARTVSGLQDQRLSSSRSEVLRRLSTRGSV